MGKKLMPIRQELNHPKVAKRASVLKQIEKHKEQMELNKLLKERLLDEKL